MGKGEITIVNTTPPGKIEMDLHMIEPFEGHNRVTFMLLPEGAFSRVTWAMDGTSSYPAKLMGLFMDMDKMIGGDFEKGLEKLKAVIEK